jgi:hypothetical protein
MELKTFQDHVLPFVPEYSNVRSLLDRSRRSRLFEIVEHCPSQLCSEKGGGTMNKLDALKLLRDAYYYLYLTKNEQDVFDALNILSDKFHHVRRSMTLIDLAPIRMRDYESGRIDSSKPNLSNTPKSMNEGLNPSGPRFF